MKLLQIWDIAAFPSDLCWTCLRIFLFKSKDKQMLSGHPQHHSPSVQSEPVQPRYTGSLDRVAVFNWDGQ